MIYTVDEERFSELLNIVQDGDILVVRNTYQQAMLESRAIGLGLDIVVQVAAQNNALPHAGVRKS